MDSQPNHSTQKPPCARSLWMISRRRAEVKCALLPRVLVEGDCVFRAIRWQKGYVRGGILCLDRPVPKQPVAASDPRSPPAR
jgi:hypothetical protein